MFADRDQALFEVSCTESVDLLSAQTLDKCLQVTGPEDVAVRSIGFADASKQLFQLAVSWEVGRAWYTLCLSARRLVSGFAVQASLPRRRKLHIPVHLMSCIIDAGMALSTSSTVFIAALALLWHKSLPQSAGSAAPQQD